MTSVNAALGMEPISYAEHVLSTCRAHASFDPIVTRFGLTLNKESLDMEHQHGMSTCSSHAHTFLHSTCYLTLEISHTKDGKEADA